MRSSSHWRRWKSRKLILALPTVFHGWKSNDRNDPQKSVFKIFQRLRIIVGSPILLRWKPVQKNSNDLATWKKYQYNNTQTSNAQFLYHNLLQHAIYLVDIIELRIMPQQYPSRLKSFFCYCSWFCSHVLGDPKVRNGRIVMWILMFLLHGSIWLPFFVMSIIKCTHRNPVRSALFSMNFLGMTRLVSDSYCCRC